jgi:RNA polymerase sigma-70 factor (ECF subfamily)
VTPGDAQVSSKQGSPFLTTHWSVVLAAAGQPSATADEALERLCRAYWYPLYAHVRRRGHGPDEAQDLTQAFFARLLEKSFLRAADRNKGRFRSFLLAALDHFLTNEWRRGQARKRGGGKVLFSIDDAANEHRYVHEPHHDETPERLFERRWAFTVLERAMQRLESEYTACGKAEHFEALKSLIGGDRADLPHSVIAARLRLTTKALNLALFRMRRRYGELIRAEIAETVAQPGDVDAELRHLMQCIRG